MHASDMIVLRNTVSSRIITIGARHYLIYLKENLKLYDKTSAFLIIIIPIVSLFR